METFIDNKEIDIWEIRVRWKLFLTVNRWP